MITKDIVALSRDPSRRRALLSVVVPAYDESEALMAFQRRLAAVLDGLEMDAENLLVDDGSRDDTLAVIRRLRKRDRRVGVIALSRNFPSAMLQSVIQPGTFVPAAGRQLPFAIRELRRLREARTKANLASRFRVGGTAGFTTQRLEYRFQGGRFHP